MANPLGNLEGLRKMALDISFKSFGVPVTILPGGPYTKRRQIKGLWIREYTETEPGGLNVSSDVPDRRLAVKRSRSGGDQPADPPCDFRWHERAHSSFPSRCAG